MDIEFSFKFRDHFEYWKKRDRKVSDKILRLIEEIQKSPLIGIGKPEPLKHELSGCWSRRINRGHRIIYRIKDDVIQFLSCRYHY